MFVNPNCKIVAGWYLTGSNIPVPPVSLPDYAKFIHGIVFTAGNVLDPELCDRVWRQELTEDEYNNIDPQTLTYGEEFYTLPSVYAWDVSLQDMANCPELNGYSQIGVWWDDENRRVRWELVASNPKPLICDRLVSDLLDRLNVALEFDLAIHNLAPKPVDGLGRDQMIERRDLRILSAIRYTAQNALAKD